MVCLHSFEIAAFATKVTRLAKAPARIRRVREVAIAVALLTQFTVSAFADTQYWVAKDAVSKQCEVVTKKPDGTLVIDLAKTIYKTEEANSALKRCQVARSDLLHHLRVMPG